MKIEEMREKREDVVEACLVQRKTNINKGKDDGFIEKGPCAKLDGNKCAAYMFPSAKWRLGDCPLATHLIKSEDEKKKVNPIKQSKRG